MLLLVSALILGSEASAQLQRDVSLFDAARHVTRTRDGVVEDVWNLELPPSAGPRASADALITRESVALFGREGLSLRLAAQRESLAGTHLLYKQTIDGVEILNGTVSVTIGSDLSLVSLHNRMSRGRLAPAQIDEAQAVLSAREAARVLGDTEVVGSRLVGWIGEDGEARPYQRVVVRRGGLRWAVFVDAVSGSAAWIEPLFFTAKGQVFDPNPVVALDQVALRDNDDSAASIPAAAYVLMDLPALESPGPLAGPHARIVDVEAPVSRQADKGENLVFDRSQDEFEEVMAYFHVDRQQRHLQSLGFTGARAVVPYPIEIDAHGSEVDNSSYRPYEPGRGRLYFGDGGVDDAEDADVIIHEYGHAIQDSIVPGGFFGPVGSQTRALGEGFSDYLAFSARWSASRTSGRDPYCLADWDTRCGDGPSTACGYAPGTSCLRRVDGTKTMADFVSSGSGVSEHKNGEIWSSALREIFVAAVAIFGDDEARKVTDRTVVESHFGLPPYPDFRTSALRVIDADRRLNSGALGAAICAAMSARGIIAPAECDLGLRGDLTLIESPARDVPIPDAAPNGISSTLIVSDARPVDAVFVRVDVEHPFRGDVRLSIVSPDGTTVVLLAESGDPGDGIRATFGLDAQPLQSLTTFAGRSAAGAWTLRVADSFGSRQGRIVSWGLLLRFSGDGAIASRPRSSGSIVVPVSGNVAGAFGSRFVSDVRLLNSGGTDARISLFFTPSGTDGSTTFSAVNLLIPAGHLIAIDDVVGAVFRETGTGVIEIRGDTAKLRVTSRIYNDAERGTFGQFVSTRGPSIGRGATLHVLHLSNGESMRSNLGVAEVAGAPGEIQFQLFDSKGGLLESMTATIPPFGHQQWPLLGGRAGLHVDSFRAEVRVIQGDARVVAYGSAV
ncbi:MAG: proprotein convertase P-domain-containing protein, partial [Thermoanaerobaculia bacterium]|nr:proprotein convertase P-domain-containing protein [Thermoanaerobaculia bacterium]